MALRLRFYHIPGPALIMRVPRHPVPPYATLFLGHSSGEGGVLNETHFVGFKTQALKQLVSWKWPGSAGRRTGGDALEGFNHRWFSVDPYVFHGNIVVVQFA